MTEPEITTREHDLRVDETRYRDQWCTRRPGHTGRCHHADGVKVTGVWPNPRMEST